MAEQEVPRGGIGNKAVEDVVANSPDSLPNTDKAKFRGFKLMGWFHEDHRRLRHLWLVPIIYLGIWAGRYGEQIIRWRQSGQINHPLMGKYWQYLGATGLLMALLILRYLRVPLFMKALEVAKRMIESIVVRLTKSLMNWGTEFLHAPVKQKLLKLKLPLLLVILYVGYAFYGHLFAPPKITVTFPGDDGKNIPVDTTIEIQFSREMNKESVEKAFSINPGVPGNFDWESGGRVIFQPSESLALHQEYTVKIGRWAMSSWMIPKLVDDEFSFNTLGHPTVLLASPQTEALDELNSITVMFDRAMIPLTTATNSALKQPAFTVTPEIKGEGRWLGTTAYQFRPSEPYQLASTYTYRVEAGLKSEDGGELQEPAVFSFSTPRPHVVAVSPARGYKYANPVASVSATLSQTVDFSSAKENVKLFYLNGISYDEVPSKLVVNKEQIGLYPLSPLKREGLYEVKIFPGLLSTNGPNGLENEYNWNFNVAKLPEVVSTNPKDGAQDVTGEHLIEVWFATPMDEDSFKDRVIISPAPDSNPTEYFSTYNDANRLAIGTYLGRSKNYTITISGQVKDQYGVALGQDYTFSFSTAPYQPSISIQPSNLYFATFNQRVVPRIVAKVVNVNQVSYRLYKLPREEFLKLFRYRFDYNVNKDLRNWQAYDTSGLELVREWEENFTINDNVPVNVITKVEMANGEMISPGLYFLEAKIPTGKHDNLAMVVSQAALTLKTAAQQSLVWAVDQSSGQVIQGMKLELVNKSGTVLDQGQTNQDGVYLSDKSLGSVDSYSNPVFAFASKDPDATVVTNAWGEGIRTYDFGLQQYYDPQERDEWGTQRKLKLYVMLDRPIYRPGQTVYFKGIAREDNDGNYRLLDQANQVQVAVMDDQQKLIYNSSLPMTGYGTFSGSFDLGKEVSVGYYQLKVSLLGNGFQQQFQVEEYQKPDFEVKVSSDRPNYVTGESAVMSVDANFYFGAPVDEAPVQWTMTTMDAPYRWSKDTRFEFGESDSYWYRPWWYFTDNSYYGGQRIAQGKGKTDDKGHYEVIRPLNISDKSTNQRIRMEAVVEDQSNRSIANSQEFVVYQAGQLVGIKPERYSGQVDNEARVEVVTIDTNGQEIADRPVTVNFYKRTWNTVKEKDEDTGEFYWTSKPSDELKASQSVVTGAIGRATAAFVPNEGGSYYVTAESVDNAGRVFKSGTYLWISGHGFSARRDNHDRIVLVPDKQTYSIGEVASVYAAVPYEQTTGLVTVERANVLDYQIIRTTPDNQNFSVAIKDNYSPNAYVSALLVKPGAEVKNPAEFKMGVTEIRVDNPKTKVGVSINPDKPKYGPGETMKAVISTKDGTGKPVQTELAVAMVDQAVWSLARASLADVYETFYRPRNLGVYTSQGLTISMDRINANVNLGSKGGSGGGCFTGETLILMGDGSKKMIKQVATGDWVLTRKNEQTDEMVSAKVEQVFVHDVNEILVINDQLQTTRVHPIYTQRGWLTAGELQIGDQMMDRDGHWVIVTKLDVQQTAKRVYDLAVGQYHTYFAGDIWVHNKGDGLMTSRENFLDTAYWEAHLETNNQGQAEINVDLPDNLTTWRLAGVAVSKETAVGSTEKQVLVTKDVLIRPLLPRFLSVGDKPQLGLEVHNTTGAGQNLQTSLMDVSGLQLQASVNQQIYVPAGGSRQVFWPVTVAGGEEAKLTMVVRNNGQVVDAVTKTLPVKSYFTPETVATAGQAADVGQETIHLPADVVADQGSLTIGLSPALGAGVQDAASYLLDYAYWCAEQTVNRLMPAVNLLQLARETKTQTIGGQSTARLEQLANDAIQRLVRSQHPDGGWGWWPTYPSSPMISTMVMDGLWAAKSYGLTVPEQTISQGWGYLKRSLSSDQESLDVQAYIAATVSQAEKVDAGVLSGLMDRRWEMKLLGRAYLWLAIEHNGGNRQDEYRLRDELLSQARKTNTSVHWEEEKTNWWLMSSSTTLTSAVLEGLTENDPQHPLISETVRWLMQVQQDGHWRTTRDTGAAVKALTKLLLAQKAGSVDEQWKLEVDNQRRDEGAFKTSDLLKQVVNTIPIAEIPKVQDVPVTISKSGKGNLFYNMNLKYYLPFEQVEPLEQGMVMVRELVDKKGNLLPPDKVSTADEIWVRLILVTPDERHHLVLEDPLPAGFEPVNESLATTSLMNVERLTRPKDRKPLYFQHQEMRDDRVVLFAEWVPAGVYEYTYRVRPTTPGSYHHPPAQIYNMYLPDISGHSAGGWLEVTD